MTFSKIKQIAYCQELNTTLCTILAQNLSKKISFLDVGNSAKSKLCLFLSLKKGYLNQRMYLEKSLDIKILDCCNTMMQH